MDTLNDIIRELKFGDLDPVETHDKVLALFGVILSLPTSDGIADAAMKYAEMDGTTEAYEEGVMDAIHFVAGATWYHKRMKSRALKESHQTSPNLLQKTMEALDDYLNAGCKEERKKASVKAKEVYKEFYGKEYINRNER